MVIWTPEKNARFLELRTGPNRRPVAEVAAEFGTTVAAIYQHARVLKATIHAHRTWTPDEVALLRDLRENKGMTDTQIRKETGWTINSIRWKVDQLGLPKTGRAPAKKKEKLSTEDKIARARAARSKERAKPRPAAQRPQMTPEIEARLREAAPTAGSISALATAAGISFYRARKYAALLDITPGTDNEDPAIITARRETLERYARGEITIKMAAKILKMRAERVKSHLDQLGLSMPLGRGRTTLSDDTIAQVGNMAKAGKTRGDVVAALGITISVARRAAAAAGVTFGARLNKPPRRTETGPATPKAHSTPPVRPSKPAARLIPAQEVAAKNTLPPPAGESAALTPAITTKPTMVIDPPTPIARRTLPPSSRILSRAEVLARLMAR